VKKFVLIRKVLHFILFFGLSISVFAQDKTSPKHILWKVSSGQGVEGYLAGSIHLVKSDFYPLDSIFNTVFNKTNPIVFELDSEKAKTGIISSFHLATYSKGDILKNHLDPDLYFKTQKHLVDIPFPNRKTLKPWFAAFLIMSLDSKDRGATVGGLDDFFYKKAKKEGKVIVALETVEQQMNNFATMEEDLQIEFLKYTLKNRGKNEAKYEKMSQYWKTGNIKAIQKLLNDKSFGQLANFSKKLNQSLVIDRNQNWRKQLESIFEKEKIPFIIVGMGHLIGKHNLIDMLEKDGYSVEQM
jgi:hypothetical protein